KPTPGLASASRSTKLESGRHFVRLWLPQIRPGTPFELHRKARCKGLEDRAPVIEEESGPVSALQLRKVDASKRQARTQVDNPLRDRFILEALQGCCCGLDRVRHFPGTPYL